MRHTLGLSTRRLTGSKLAEAHALAGAAFEMGILPRIRVFNRVPRDREVVAVPLRYRRLADVRLEDIDLLIRNKVIEHRTIDYKRELPGFSDKGRKDFLADVVSFANTGGGDIVFGVQEKGGAPVMIVGIKEPDADKAIQRLQEMITTGIKPRVSPRCNIQALGREDGSYALILRVPQSVQAPHMVSFQTTLPFHSRLIVGKHSMDIDEVRDSFLRSAERPNRVRAFHSERVEHYEASSFPLDLSALPRAVVHLIPFYSLDQRIQLSPTELLALAALVPPLAHEKWRLKTRFNLDGLAQMKQSTDEPKCVGQFFRSGIIETAAELRVRAVAPDQMIDATLFEDNVIEWLRDALIGCERVGLQVPFVFLMTLNTRTRCRLHPPYPSLDPAHERWFDRPDLPLPELMIEDTKVDPAKALQPTFDALWNAAGFERCANYTDLGERRS